MRKTMTAGITLLATAAAAFAQTDQRPPAVPLVANDPYFSVWSMNDELAGGPTRHWTTKHHSLTSLVRIDGRAFRVMGRDASDVAAAKQTARTVTPTRSIYEFQEGGVKLTLTFMTPLLPDDLMVLSRPVSYLTYTVVSTDGKDHDVSVHLDAAAELAVNLPNQTVVAQSGKAGGLTTARVGTEEQPVLGSRGDDHRIDWGYFYVAAPAGAAGVHPADEARAAFAGGKPLPAAERDASAKPARDADALVVSLPALKASAEPKSQHVVLAYDDLGSSIRYFNSDLKGYWAKDGMTFDQLLQTADKEYADLAKKCEAFDAELTADMKKLGGDSYVQLGVLAWRQSLAAQKLCADANGQPLSFSKENNSNGCCATVDVMYPASPLMMVFSPSLLRATLQPIIDYSSSPRWKHDSAPHDIGTYPIATGQVYGGGDSDSGMPVEETGNMLCMLGALSKVEGNADYAKAHWPLLTRWANYLKNNGFDPGNQLTTDDFAGHIARNTNLSAKAIMGVASYAMMADMMGQEDEAAKWTQIAKDAAQEWMKKSDQGTHYGLVFGDKGRNTWSQKYNLVWDTLLDLNVFPKDVAKKEVAYYLTKMNKYGVPLDSRRDYTKVDWTVWSSTMATDKADAQKMLDACARFYNETTDRVAMSDWVETKVPKRSGFMARSVVGGVFLPFMKDADLWKKYASRDKTKIGTYAEVDFAKPETRIVLAAADTEPADWQYTTTKPDRDDWMAVDYAPANGWKTGKSGFGTRGTPAAVIGTRWNGDDIWLRREFTLDSTSFKDLRLYVHHDEAAEIFINGVRAARPRGYTAEYVLTSISPAAMRTLKVGKNVIAVHCNQTTAGQYIDVGLADLMPKKQK